MREFLPNIDTEKLKRAFQIKEAYDRGELTLDQAQAQLQLQVKSLQPYEVALIEQELKPEVEDECRKEDIQAMITLFDGVLVRERPDLPPEHPLSCYYRENDKIREILGQIQELVQYPAIKNQWLALYEPLSAWRKHLQRKQNQLYPLLERKGFTRPTTTMWTLDDFVRQEIDNAYKLLLSAEETSVDGNMSLLTAENEEKFISLQADIVADVLDLMQKEETVLYPTSLALIIPEEFELMRRGDQEIGFANITVNPPDAAAETTTATPGTVAGTAAGTAADISNFAADLAALVGKYYPQPQAGGELEVSNGKMTLEQINLLFRHMPVDFCYVDENEIVKFYNDTPKRVFPRSLNVIGRNVKNCHPRKSVHIVEEIIAKFRSGEQEQAEFWINKPDVFIYILYTAVRDKTGKFRGILEMMQDCTHIRSLQGSRTLLTWEKEAAPANNEASAAPMDTAGTVGQAAAVLPEKVQKIVPEEINAETMLKDLLAADKNLKSYLFTLSFKFRALDTPLARIMLPKAKVSDMSERSGIPLNELLAKLRAYFADRQK